MLSFPYTGAASEGCDGNGMALQGAIHQELQLCDGPVTPPKAAYQDFFSLWKDADPDIPILKQAKTEYAKLQ
jgi:hypothetical protein